MKQAASLTLIKKQIGSELPRKVTVLRRETIHEVGYMIPQMMNRPVRYQTVREQKEQKSKLIGILLCHPNSPLAKSEILGHLPFFHVRSGKAIDFFCAGYGAFWPPEHHSDSEVVARINGQEWLFSNDAFLHVITELEQESRWKYSGETELLLIPTSLSDTGEPVLQYDSAIVCNLEGMARDKAFTSVRAFFDDIFRHANTQNASSSLWNFSDTRGIEVAESILKQFILSLLPRQLQMGYTQASHYAIRNLANDV